ncbi:CpsD/CapB family tyrosine-protein kinase [Dongia sp.]|uniref:CpsD/CapB family tyrosine-protein kinase n=1 Tax=Dongia sp. TaxID=1977262 RepID=UPI0035B4F466
MEQIEKAMARAREARAGNLKQLRPANAPGGRGSTNGVAPAYTETTMAPQDLRRMNEERLIADALGHPVSDTYGLLRTQVLQRMRANNMSVLAVTSPESGAGVTTTAANLALAVALDVNQTVLLVDLNLREPDLHRKFHIKPQAGIDDYLHGTVELRECLVCPGVPRLVVLPARAANGEAAEVLSSPRMAALARELRNRYQDRIIIYDMPPLIPSGDTLGFLPNVDAVLLVARAGKTTKNEIEKSAYLLGSKPIVGTLLNAH